MKDPSIYIVLRNSTKEELREQHQQDVKTVTKFKKICNLKGIQQKRVVIDFLKEWNEKQGVDSGTSDQRV